MTELNNKSQFMHMAKPEYNWLAKFVVSIYPN